jgi:predicted acylesterase/phospholipase RssA
MGGTAQASRALRGPWLRFAAPPLWSNSSKTGALHFWYDYATGKAGNRTMRRVMLVILMGLMLGSCAWRGALKMDCADFASRVHPLQRTVLEWQIRGENYEEFPRSDIELARRLAAPELARLEQDEAFLNATPRAQRPILLLSGGGQWGAFGVGLMDELVKNRQFPDFSVVTGVSTGALQALFVGAGMDSDDAEGAAIRTALIAAYSPKKESDIVDRESTQALAAINGALANLKPLRRRFEERICPKIYDPKSPAGQAGACLIAKLRDPAGRKVLLGSIEAQSGEFGYVDVQELLAPYGDSDEDLGKATQCLAGAAIASAAVPVFYQQVRVDGRTYYDGGVRQSVFLASVANAQHMAAEMVDERRQALLAQRGIASAGAGAVPTEPPSIYVIRNGPTVLEPEDYSVAGYQTPRIDKKADALHAAQRGEAIMVNQLEVGSIMALRLARPGGSIFFVSADGWKNYTPIAGGETCGKIKPRFPNAMFIPEFMQCIMDQGRNRNRGTLPWTELCKYDGTETREFCLKTPMGVPPRATVPQAAPRTTPAT